MQACRSIRLWNRFVLTVLVLLVTGSAFCTVAASATAQQRGSIGAPTAAP